MQTMLVFPIKVTGEEVLGMKNTSERFSFYFLKNFTANSFCAWRLIAEKKKLTMKIKFYQTSL